MNRHDIRKELITFLLNIQRGAEHCLNRGF